MERILCKFPFSIRHQLLISLITLILFQSESFLSAEVVVAANDLPLLDYLHYYEPLKYSEFGLDSSHRRRKRSASSWLNFNIFAHHTNLRLKLRPDTESFHHNAKLEVDDVMEPIDKSFLYIGSVVGIPDSFVSGNILDGIFTGFIRLPNETFYIERAAYHFTTPKEKLSFHSIIYKGSDVDDSVFGPSSQRRLKRSIAQTAVHCGLDIPYIHDMMDYEQHQRVIRNEEGKKIAVEISTNKKKGDGYDERGIPVHTFSLYSKEAQELRKRQKRDVKLVNVGVCSLHMQSDPLLFNHVKKILGGDKISDGRVKDEIIAKFQSHVAAATDIYKKTVFQSSTVNDKSFTQTTFKILKSTVITPSICNEPSNPKQKFCKSNVDVAYFLNMVSQADYDSFCLAYMFTYRDFSGGTLGLAWVASAGLNRGGICEKYGPYRESGSLSQVYKSLNSGIVTLVNYGNSVPLKVSTLTFAHELGHNFGAKHDPTTAECSPASVGNSNKGNYIMYSSATSGDLPNNVMFSECSKDSIARTLNYILNRPNRPCFTKNTNVPFCSNGIIEKCECAGPPKQEGCECDLEDSEQCDCGDADDCKNQACCNIFKSSAKDSNCKLTSGSSCSSEPCCDHTTCKPVSKARNVTCLAKTDCAQASVCNGSSKMCPAPTAEENKLPCNKNTQICVNGTCSQSICEKIEDTVDWTDCFILANTSSDKQERKKLCYVACQRGDETTCWSSYDFTTNNFPLKFKNMLQAIKDKNEKDSELAIKLQPGAACNNYKGYCDAFQVCRQVDAEGPLSRLKNLFFSEESLNKVKEWVMEHWWAVLLMCLGVIIFMGVFIKCCSVHTPSSNPNLKQARSVRDTLTLRRRSPRSAGPSSRREDRRRNNRGRRPDTEMNYPPPQYQLRAQSAAQRI